MFKRTNRVLTLLRALSSPRSRCAVHVAIKTPNTSDWTNWEIAIVLIVAAVKITQTYPERVRARAQGGG